MTIVWHSGVYSHLVTRFVFSRNIGFYLIQIYLPSILIVIISWVSFWLSRDATPARVSLGVTTVLTMTTLMTTTNSAMPKVSYVKSIDIYLMACFFLVFASLLEYAVVGYMNKKLRMKKETKIQSQVGSVGGLAPSVSYFQGKLSSFGPTSAQKHKMYPAGVEMMNEMNSMKSTLPYGERNANNYVSGPGPTAPLLFTNVNLPATNVDLRSRERSGSQTTPECDCDIEQGQAIRRIQLHPSSKPKKSRRFRGYRGPNPSSVDKYSRIFFPAFFLVFNAVYWAVSLHLSAVAKSRTSP